MTYCDLRGHRLGVSVTGDKSLQITVGDSHGRAEFVGHKEFGADPASNTPRADVEQLGYLVDGQKPFDRRHAWGRVVARCRPRGRRHRAVGTGRRHGRDSSKGGLHWSCPGQRQLECLSHASKMRPGD